MNPEKLDQFIELHHITGHPSEFRNTNTILYLGGPDGNKRYEVRLCRENNVYEYLQVYTDKGVEDVSLAFALWNLIDHAEDGGYFETYARWRKENKEYEKEFGPAVAREYYEYCRICFHGLIKVLGEDLYRELSALLRDE
jgi:hypothetical protein